MDNNNLTEISDDLFTLIMEFHRKLLKPEEFIKNSPMPPSHVKVIFYLSQNGPSSISEIARDLCISKPNMTPIIDRLITEGFATRYEDPKDRRKLSIEVTKKACECFKMKKQIAKELLHEKISILSDEDLTTLSNAIKEFYNIITKL